MNTNNTVTNMGTSPLVTMLTDFGVVDSFVGVMKGIIHGIHPVARVIDLTHEIPPHDIRAGAFGLLTAYRYFPHGTVHLAIVDPGVGTGRRAVVIVTTHFIFIGPDNGILTWAAKDDGMRFSVSITNDEYLLSEQSTTFHGRDIFAPAAAHLCRGVGPDELGERIENPLVLDFPEPQHHGTSRIVGSIIHIDRFGNLITNVRLTDDEKSRIITVTLKDVDIPGLSRTYKDVTSGTSLALVGSSGFVEIACNESNSADILGARRDDEVILELED